MAEVLLFHHAQGQTPGFHAFADELRPAGVPVQIHGMDKDPYFAGEGDIDAARELVASTDQAELFVYPGDQHYFADSSLPSYDPEATKLLTKRVLDFLATR